MAQVSFTGYSYRLTDQGIIVFDTAVLTFEAIGDNLEFSYSIASDEGLFSPIDFDPENYDHAYVTAGDIALSLLEPNLLFYMGSYFWDGSSGSGTAQVFDVTTSPVSGYVFTFNGDALPDLLDLQIATAWYASILDYQLIDQGILAIDSTVQFTTLDHAEIQYGDTITGTMDGDTLDGGGGADLLKGFGGSDFLFGRGGDDKLLGNGGTDHLYGGAGNDVLRGGRGGDWLTVGAGSDKLWGGPGADYFLFDADLDNGVDRIKDFDPGSDRIVIEHLDGFGDVTFRQVDRGLRLEFQDTAIILAGLDASQISADDFLFL
jgi:Ca2+-binding RTX toxin-like protein